MARSCSDPRPLVLPLVPYGVSYHHNAFSGTFSLTNETMAKLIYEIGMSAARNGVAKLVMINGRLFDARTMDQIGKHPGTRPVLAHERVPDGAPR